MPDLPNAQLRRFAKEVDVVAEELMLYGATKELRHRAAKLLVSSPDIEREAGPRNDGAGLTPWKQLLQQQWPESVVRIAAQPVAPLSATLRAALNLLQDVATGLRGNWMPRTPTPLDPAIIRAGQILRILSRRIETHARQPRRRSRRPRPLTNKQKRAWTVWAETNSYSAVGEALGIDRTTARDHVQLAAKKLGTQIQPKIRPKLQQLPEDHRGQISLSAEDQK